MGANLFARPIIPILITVMAGIICGDRLPGYDSWILWVAMLAAVGVAGAWWRKREALALPLTLFLAIGYLSIQPWTAPVFPVQHVIHHADSRKWAVTGVVTDTPVIRPKRIQFTLAATGLKRGKKDFPVCGRIRVSLGDENTVRIRPGDRIQVTGHLKRVHGFHNPGGFNYERYLAFKKIWCRMWVSSRHLIFLERPAAPPVTRWISRIRDAVSGQIDRAVSSDSRPILKALIIGDRSGISPELRQIFSRTGTGHLLAISGLHIGIVASVSFFLLKWLLVFSRFLRRRAWAGKTAAFFTLVPVLVYGVLAGMSPSTQRAVVMISVFLLAYIIGRRHDTANTLAAAGMIILAVFPPALFSISFQLSFAAVGFIILGMSRRWPEISSRKSPARPGLKRIGLLTGTTFLATAGTLPLVMGTFNTVSLIGIGANLIAVPLIGFIVVPIGLFGALAHAFSAALAMYCFQVAGFFLSVSLAVIRFLADCPFAAIKTFSPTRIETVLYYAWVSMGIWLAPAFLSWLRGRHGRQRPGVVADIPVRRLVAAVIIIGAATAVDGGYWIYHRFLHRDLRVTVIDVGTGSAALVEFPRGPVMLIDGGGFTDNTVFDVGARVVAPVLWHQKIMTVDTIVLSHPNSDHLNGLIYIADHFHVKRFWSNGEPAHTYGYRQLMKVVARRRIDAPLFRNLPRIISVHGARVAILYPPATFHPDSNDDADANNHSLVVKISLGKISFLFPGDIEKEAEKELAALQRDALRSTILIAPHHGSRTSSSPDFLDTVSPETVIISCDRAGRYHFPHPTVLKRYRRRGYKIFSTGRSGAIQMVTNGQKIKIRPALEASQGE